MELLLDGADETTLALVAWLRTFHTARQAVRIAEPPATTHTLLRAQFAAFVAGRGQPSLHERIVATLRFDSFTHPMAALGTRTVSGASMQRRQLLFACAMADIALHIQRRPHDNQIDVNGQIFPHGTITPAGWGVLLIGDNGPDATQTDDLGEFTFEEVDPGDYTITVETNQLVITMPMVSLVP
jgi:hypothetical protein